MGLCTILRPQKSVEVVISGASRWLASLYRFNRAGTDYQVLLGKRHSSWMMGAGGAIGQRRAERRMELFRPRNRAYEYPWPNTLMLRQEALLNANPIRTGRVAADHSSSQHAYLASCQSTGGIRFLRGLYKYNL